MEDEPKALPGSALKSAQELLRSAGWAIRLAWSASAFLLVAVVTTSMVRALTPAALALTARGLVNSAIAGVGSSPDLWPMAPWLILGFVVTVFDGLCGAAGTLSLQRLRDDLNYRITADILTHAAKLDVAFYEDPRAQDVLQRAKDNPAGHIAHFLINVITATCDAIQIASLLGILVFLEPAVVLVLLIFTAPYLRYQWALVSQHFALERSRTRKRRWTQYFVSLVTTGSSVGEVRLLRLAPLLIERFRSLMAEFRDQDRQLFTRRFAQNALFIVVTTAAFYTVFVRVAWGVLTGAVTVGDLAVFGTATSRLRFALEHFVFMTSTAMEETLYVSNIIEFLQTVPREDRGRAIPGPSGRAAIELRNVHFTYPGTVHPALTDVSLHIAPGETIAVVGENGAGKTTLVKLIARLWDPDAGSILFDGVDLRELSSEALHRRIAFVFQAFGRYEASAADNIGYGDWPALLADRARVEEVARVAGVDAMIESLPRGYDTLLGRTFGDHDLSAGQWQKIAVARAFARDAALLILDEPTSNLDARAEYALFDQFRRLAHGRTTIIVSHRFSTVSMADRIVVMDRGRIVESGTHADLLARAGNYADLYDLHQRTRLTQAG